MWSPYTITVIAIEKAGVTILGWPAELVTAIATIAIALIALGLSFFESRRMRKHNEFSVMPALDTMQKIIPGESKGTSEMHFGLLNVGVGPAFINRYAIFFDDTELVIDTLEAKEEIENLMRIEISDLIEHAVGYATSIGAGENREMLYAKITGPEKNLQAFADRLGFKIDYRSIYKNKPLVCASRNTSGYPKDKSPTQEKQKD